MTENEIENERIYRACLEMKHILACKYELPRYSSFVKQICLTCNGDFGTRKSDSEEIQNWNRKIQATGLFVEIPGKNFSYAMSVESILSLRRLATTNLDFFWEEMHKYREWKYIFAFLKKSDSDLELFFAGIK